MITLPGFTVIKKIYESDSTLVYRARSIENNKHVILKVLRKNYPLPEEIIRYRQEYEITGNLASLPGVIDTYGQEKYKNTLVIILEDFGAESLSILMNSKEFSLKEFLTIAIQSADILGNIHGADVIHKDINPSNIVLNPESGQLKIIDFGISSALPRENPALKNPEVIEGTLAYISPEQTGRMNRSIDYRTDFYSLGATFYELLLHRPPFNGTVPMELVHSHMAIKPTPPHKVSQEIPRVVSDIIMKLLSKNAEDRYQSAWGIKTDLKKCLENLHSNGSVSDFPIGHQDISDRFQIPQKLYGRKPEIDTLKVAFDRVSSGKNEFMLVSGYSGIGKTALVQEMYKPITQHHGYFISGKYDQFQRNIPYSGLIHAFEELIRQLLTESEAKLNAWREKLLKAMGSNGLLIIDVIPEVELITGPQPQVADLPPAETQNRFNLVFQNFIQVLTEPEHPVVLFLDDLQWADGDSLRLVKLIMTDTDSRSLFFIGAYRDNEVNATHPLKLTLDEIQKAGTIVNHISLKPLNLQQINRLVSDSLNCEQEKSLPLAELVFSKTNGNPFFTGEFLKSLYKKKQIEFDYKHLKWKWSTAQIHAINITDNVVELVANKIQNLTGDLQHVLKLAACTGNQFELKALSIVCEKSQRETVLLLRGALALGFIVPFGDAYKYVEFDLPEPADGLTVEYRFSHDRIQQAVYSLIPETERSSVHLKMGRQLLKETRSDMLEHKIFDITNQLNNGIELINQDSEKYELARLNLIAGKKAKAAAAYEHAFRYLNTGIKLVTSQQSHTLNKTSQKQTFWQTHYDLALELHVEAAEAAYLSLRFDKMEQLIQLVHARARNLLDKVKAYEIEIQAFYAQNKMMEAVNTALSAMEMLGVSYPNNPNKLNILLAFIKTKFALIGKNIEDLESLSPITHPNMQAALQIIASSVLPAHNAAPKLFPLFVFKAINIAVKYGAAPITIFAFAGYGLILCGVMGDIESGYKFGKLAIDLLNKLDAKEFKIKTLVVVNSFIIHWKKHLRETLQPLLDAYQFGIEAGEPEFASISANLYCRHSYFAGRELPGLEQEIATYWHAIDRLKQKTPLYYQSAIRQVVSNLMGKSIKSHCLIGEWYDEEEMLPIHMEDNNKTAIFMIYLYKIILNYLFYRFHDAVGNAISSKKYIDDVKSSSQVPIFYFYDSLSSIAVFPDAQKHTQKRILKKVASNQKKMKKWAHNAPMNYLHKFYLVKAERCRILSEDTKAIELYDQAISLAGKHEYINEEALANELAGRFYLSVKKIKIAEKYITNARYCYLRWGATAKVKDLDTRYPELLGKTPVETKTEALNKPAESIVDDSGKVFDLISMMKISQAISSEIVLPRLLDKLMRIVIENAGAQKGILILKSQGKLLIEAEGSVNQHNVRLLHSVPLEKAMNLSHAVINYVSRNHEYLVLNNPVQDSVFMNDAYILTHKPKSILCGPLLHKSELIGVLYLENSLISEAFSGERLEVIKLLGSQIAVSLENARLYKDTETQTEEIRAVNVNLSREIEQRRKAESELTRYRDHLEELVEQRTAELQESRHALANLKRDMKKRRHFQDIIGNSERMHEIYEYIEYLTNVSATVLITGESGTGKELVANALHRAGNRIDKPFISVNCSALSENILESELFGHVKGAFTGAEKNKSGRFQKAGDGTIFLDEIGDISARFQKRLLRVLQEKEFEQVGDTTSRKMKARVVAATNQDLLKKVRLGEFREDLYYRLKVVELNLPPLRDRKEDIPLLISHFLAYFNDELDRKITGVSTEVLKQFMEYHWPGNIRELKNILEHICIICNTSVITADDLPADFSTSNGHAIPSKNNKNNSKQAILKALEEARWNKTRAAQLLGISRRTLYRRIENLNIMAD